MTFGHIINRGETMAINIITHDYSIARNTTAGRNKIRYIVLHYTATNGATAANEVAYFGTNPAATGASADFFVDDKEIRQYNTALDSRYSWAVGVDYSGGTAPYHGKCTNTNSVSIEMCCYLSGGRWYINDGTFRNAAALTKYLMAKYGVAAGNVIRHWDVCGKQCPGAVGWVPAFGEGEWLRFKAKLEGTAAPSGTVAPTPAAAKLYRVRRSPNDAKTQLGAFRSLENAKALADKSAGFSVFDETGALIYKPNALKKTTDELAREVIAGRWGNGSERVSRLSEAGYDPAAVQSRVNALLS